MSDRQRPSSPAVSNDLALLFKIQQQRQRFKVLENQLSGVLVEYWHGMQTNWAQFEQTAQAWVQLQSDFVVRIASPEVLSQALKFASQHDFDPVQ